jgi:hypothetical protein
MQMPLRIVIGVVALIAASNFTSAQTPAQNSVVGSIPGSFDVTLSGSAGYSVPIKVAPGARRGPNQKFNWFMTANPSEDRWAQDGRSAGSRQSQEALKINLRIT